jgi:hypothetical protein
MEEFARTYENIDDRVEEDLTGALDCFAMK